MKRRFSAIQIFLAAVGVIVMAAVVYDVSRRASVTVTPKDRVPSSFADMNLTQLRARFESTLIASTEFRPSTMQALEQRAEIARMMIRKSATAEEMLDSEELLLGALTSLYSIKRNNKKPYAGERAEMEALLEKIVADREHKVRALALLIQFDLESHALQDGKDGEAALQRMKQLVDTLRADFPDPGTADMIEKTILELMQSGLTDTTVDQLLEYVSGKYADHEDPQLREWSETLGDNRFLRKHDVFRIHVRLRNQYPGASKEYLAALPEILKEPLSASGLRRLAGFCNDLEAANENADASACFDLIARHIEGLPPSEETGNTLQACRDGMTRIAALGTPARLSFVDVFTGPHSTDDAKFRNVAFVVGVFSANDEFEQLYSQYLSIEALRSRNVRLLVLFQGMTAEQVRSAQSGMADSGVLMVADPDSTSEILAICPVRETPFFWVLSRSHIVQDTNILPDQMAQVCEALMFSN